MRVILAKKQRKLGGSGLLETQNSRQKGPGQTIQRVPHGSPHSPVRRGKKKLVLDLNYFGRRTETLKLMKNTPVTKRPPDGGAFEETRVLEELKGWGYGSRPASKSTSIWEVKRKSKKILRRKNPILLLEEGGEADRFFLLSGENFDKKDVSNSKQTGQGGNRETLSREEKKRIQPLGPRWEEKHVVRPKAEGRRRVTVKSEGLRKTWEDSMEGKGSTYRWHKLDRRGGPNRRPLLVLKRWVKKEGVEEKARQGGEEVIPP